MAKKKKSYAPPALFTSYLFIVLSIILFHYKAFDFLTIEWLVVPILVAGAVFYFFRIDSRYLIIPAILLLALCPFLLIYKLSAAAESCAVYVYYFLAAGVILQMIEFKAGYQINLDLKPIQGAVLNRSSLYMAIIWAVVFGLSFFVKLGTFRAAVTLYMAVVFLVMYIMSFFVK